MAFACVATQIKGWQMKLTCNSGKLLIAFLFRPSRNSAGISELFIPATAPHHPQCPEKSNAKSGMIQYDSYKKWCHSYSRYLWRFWSGLCCTESFCSLGIFIFLTRALGTIEFLTLVQASWKMIARSRNPVWCVQIAYSNHFSSQRIQESYSSWKSYQNCDLAQKQTRKEGS